MLVITRRKNRRTLLKSSDYIVEFLVEKGIQHVFGYPGGMVTHLMNSLSKYETQITAHLCYHEQGAAFAACGYAQTTHIPGVAYATSGPGATNLITGIANAFYDSIPCIFITGQVNTYESKGALSVRQKGFQEMDVVSVVASITKYAVQIQDANLLMSELEKAYTICMEGRPGPVVLDIPMNIQRAEIEPPTVPIATRKNNRNDSLDLSQAWEQIKKAKRPCLLIGAGVKTANKVQEIREALRDSTIPIVSSMLGVDIFPRETPHYFGFIGAYGDRCANFIVSKCDLLLSIGSRLDCRQTGTNLDGFAPAAQIIRFDVDPDELTNRIRETDLHFVCPIEDSIAFIKRIGFNVEIEWQQVCKTIYDRLRDVDRNTVTDIVHSISQEIPDHTVITTDVGQNQVWTAQAFVAKANQQLLFSGGHGAMGYSLPAAIGAYYGTGKRVVSLNGDGGIQMNLQELNLIGQHQLPIKIVVFNNRALGMIRHFQEMYFGNNNIHTTQSGGFSAPRFDRIAQAFEIEYYQFDGDFAHVSQLFRSNRPLLLEIPIDMPTYVTPKLAMGKPNQDQDPLLDRTLYDFIMEL